MLFYEPKSPPSRSLLLQILLGALSAGLMLEMAAAQSVLADDERAPLIVSDDPAPVAGLVRENPAAAPGIGVEETKKAILGDPVLLDPTIPTEELRAAIIPGERETGTMLLPSGTVDRPAGTPPLVEPGAGGKKAVRPPITGSAPFAPETKGGSGPVVMGTDLEPNAAVTALAPEQTSPEMLDAPLVESADPWVFRVEQISVYDDNIELGNRGKQADFVFMLRASVAWQRGDLERRRGSWARVFYEATGSVFVDRSDENSLDHDLQAGGQRRWGDLATALEGRYRYLSGATPDLGDRVQRQEYEARLSAAYDLSGRTFV